MESKCDVFGGYRWKFCLTSTSKYFFWGEYYSAVLKLIYMVYIRGLKLEGLGHRVASPYQILVYSTRTSQIHEQHRKDSDPCVVQGAGASGRGTPKAKNRERKVPE